MFISQLSPVESLRTEKNPGNYPVFVGLLFGFSQSVLCKFPEFLTACGKKVNTVDNSPRIARYAQENRLLLWITLLNCEKLCFCVRSRPESAGKSLWKTAWKHRFLPKSTGFSENFLSSAPMIPQAAPFSLRFGDFPPDTGFLFPGFPQRIPLRTEISGLGPAPISPRAWNFLHRNFLSCGISSV